MTVSGADWRAVFWRKAIASLRGLGVWIPVCLVVLAAGYALLEGWSAFLLAASDPAWWVLRIGGILIFWVVCDIDRYKPRWRAIPSVILPVAGAALSSFAVLKGHPEAWFVPICISILAFGLNWLLIRRWRVYYAVDQRSRDAATSGSRAAIST